MIKTIIRMCVITVAYLYGALTGDGYIILGWLGLVGACVIMFMVIPVIDKQISQNRGGKEQ